MFKDDKLVLDTTELRLNWAIDDVANGINELLEHLESRKDTKGLAAFSKLVKAMNSYVRVIEESLNAAPTYEGEE